MISAWSWVAVVPALFTGSGGEAPAWLLVREQAALTFSTPAKPSEPLGFQWVAEAGGVLWYWHPQQGLGRLRVSRSAPKVEEGWMAPAPQLEPSALAVVALAPWAADGTYLVEPRRYWKWSQGSWQGPWEVADRVASAVALGPGRLLVNTPEHPVHPFAVLGDGGKVLSRFGERRAAPHPALLVGENSWRLARSPVDGSVFAAHRYWPLVSRWKADGTFLWQRRLDSPAARRLEQLQRAFLQTEPWGQTGGGCWVCEWLEVTLAALVDQRGNLWLRLGGGIAVEVVAPDGQLLETVAVEGRWETPAGMSLWGQRLYVWEGSGLATFRLRKNERVAEVRVQNHQGQPVAGAKVEVSAEGIVFEVLSDRRGRARFEAPPAGSEGYLRVTAPTYRRAEREGVVPELFSAPVVLEPADTLCVQVEDAESGAPVRSFFLAADRVGTASAPAMEEGEGVPIEDAEGKGCVEVTYRYPVELRVAADGYASWRGLVEKAPAEAVAVALQPAALLEVTVIDPEERPVENASVTLVPGREVEKSAYALGDDFLKVTDAQGRAVFSRLGPGSYRARIRAREFLPFETSWKLDQGRNEQAREFLPFETSWKLERGRNEQRVQLERGGTVRVAVVNKATKEPIAGIQVTLRHGQDSTFERSCPTDGSGQCALSGVPPGNITILAEASGWSPRRQPGTVRPGEREVSLTVELQKGVKLLGRVLGMEAYPESQLLAVVSAPGMPVERLPLDAEGRFVVAAVPPGFVNLWVRDEQGRGELVSKFTEVPGDQESYEVELELPPPVEFTGEVLAQGQPCSGCAVELALLSAEVSAPRFERTTGSDGRFQARLPRVGLWQVQIAPPQGGPGLEELVEVTGNLHRVFQLGEASLAVRVQDEARQPVDRAWVRVFSGFSGRALREANSDFQGRARWTGLPSGAVRVVASSEGQFAEGEIELEAGQEKELLLVLRSGQELKLRLINAATGLPLTTGVVRFGFQTPQGYRVLRQGAGADGVYRLPLGGERAQALVIHAPGFAMTTLHGSWGAETGVLEVQLSPDLRSFSVEVRGGLQACSLTVRDERGWPVALSADYPPGPVPFSAPAGMFNFLPPGRYRVELTPCSGSPLEREMVLAPGLRPHLVFP